MRFLDVFGISRKGASEDTIWFISIPHTNVGADSQRQFLGFSSLINHKWGIPLKPEAWEEGGEAGASVVFHGPIPMLQKTLGCRQ